MTAARFLGAVTFLVLLGTTVPAAEPTKPTPATPVSWYRDVRPIFQQHCNGCHQPAKPSGGFVMTAHAQLLKKGESDLPGVVPGKVEASNLLTQIVGQGGKKPVMPRGKDPLATREIDLVRRWILEGAKDDTPASDRVVIDQDHPPTYVLPPVITAMAYSPKGDLLAVSGYHEILVHRADGSGLVARLVGQAERIQSLAFSPDGKSLAMAGGSPGRFGEIQIWDLDKNKLRVSVSMTFDTLYGISWAHDSSKVAFGCADNTVRALDAASGKQVLFNGAHNDWVLGTVFSADSDYLVSISRDRTAKLTEVATQRFIDNVTSITPGALKGGLMALARRPMKEQRKVTASSIAVADTRPKIYDELLFGGSDGTPRLYKMHRETKRVIGDDANRVREYEAMPGRIHAVAFSPDGKVFATGSSFEGNGEVRVYQVDDGKRLPSLQGQKGGVFAVVFRPDGKAVASAGFDGRVRLNDPTTGKLIREFVPVPGFGGTAAR